MAHQQPQNPLPAWPDTPLIELYQAAMVLPCSNVWPVMQDVEAKRQKATGQRAASKKKSRGTKGKSKLVLGKHSRPASDGENETTTRHFHCAEDKENPALTRRLHACIRCRFQRRTCKIDPDDPSGPCLTCSDRKRGGHSKFPCLRYKVTDASL